MGTIGSARPRTVEELMKEVEELRELRRGDDKRFDELVKLADKRDVELLRLRMLNRELGRLVSAQAAVIELLSKDRESEKGV